MKLAWNDYLEYKGEKIPTEKDYPTGMSIIDLKEWYSCQRSKEYFRNSDFYYYMLNKNRTKLIDEMTK